MTSASPSYPESGLLARLRADGFVRRDLLALVPLGGAGLGVAYRPRAASAPTVSGGTGREDTDGREGADSPEGLKGRDGPRGAGGAVAPGVVRLAVPLAGAGQAARVLAGIEALLAPRWVWWSARSATRVPLA